MSRIKKKAARIAYTNYHEFSIEHYKEMRRENHPAKFKES